MATPAEEARLKEHVAELRRAARGIGRDVSIELDNLGRKIEKLPSITGKELKYELESIARDFDNLGHTLGHEIKEVPGEIASIMRSGLGAVRDGARAAAGAAASVGHAAKEGTKNTLAAAAGVNRKPMKQWSAPPAGATGSDEEEK